MTDSLATVATTVWFNKTVVAQAAVVAPTMKFWLNAHYWRQLSAFSQLCRAGHCRGALSTTGGRRQE